MKKIILVALTGFAVLSCKKEATTEVETSPTAPTIEAPVVDAPESSTDIAEGVVKLEIHGDDAMKYDKNEFRVPAGSTVELTLKHVGEMKKETMGHNWTLLKQGTDVQAFAMEAINAKDSDYIPAGTDAVIAHTKMLGGGESDKITFQAPEAGTYDFICTFPGHFGSMKGKFIVE